MFTAAYLPFALPVLLLSSGAPADRLISLVPAGCMVLLLIRYRRGSGRISASLYLCIQSLFLLFEWLGPEQVPIAVLLSIAAITLAGGSWRDRICAHDLCSLMAVTAISWFVAVSQNTSAIWEALLFHLALAALDILAEETFFHTGTHAVVERKQITLLKPVSWYPGYPQRKYELIILSEPASEPTLESHPEATA
jgi:multisubunit Na+/H+ antiporter MnhF subunit